MACTSPIRIRAKRKNKDGFTDIDGHQMVPCGKCNQCRQRRVNDWVLRLTEEDKHYLGGVFVTLTYAPDFVNKTKNGLLTVSKRDVQLFFKRLRKNTGKKIKYYCAAEYGSITQRPHYHLIMFGCTREDIADAWPLGEIHVGNVTGASIAYSLKYISKEKLIPMHARDDRVPEFALMSKNLGLCYLTPQIIKYHRENEASYFVKEGGYKAALPRYYRDRIFDQIQKDSITFNQQIKFRQQYEKAVEAAGGPTEYYRLQGERARYEMKMLKLKRKNETLKL